ncbi:MAG: DUF3488 and transglutaminase-like domain-containing protein [Thermodesulfobacteriota bacterium]
MNISGAVFLFTHLLALIGFFSLAGTGELHPASIAVFAFALLNSYAKGKYNWGFYLPGTLLNTLGVLVTVYVVLSSLFLGKELFDGIIILLVYIQVLKLLGKKEIRDSVLIYVLSFFQFIAGTVLTVDLSYGISFVLYVTVAVWAIIVLNLKRESEEAPEAVSKANGPRLISPMFLGATALISFVMFMFTALIFVSVPRLDIGFLNSKFLKAKQLRTGFSDHVELGQVGRIKRDVSPVMRVKILNAQRQSLPETMYWRGIALDEFDGRVWRVGDYGYYTLKSDANGLVRLKESRAVVVAQEILTEPIDSRVLFALDSPVAYKGLITGKVYSMNDSYMLPIRGALRLKYIAYSDLTEPSPKQLRKAGTHYPPYITNRYLQLPKLGERVKRLAEDLAVSENNPYDIAVTIKRYLLENLSYTLTLKEGEEVFPLEVFLFENREGHCEYFATAMVMLLRERGIPSRIVNGFIGGQWNEYGGFFLIRESDAHSWVEAYFPGQGWVKLDPTPGGAGNFYQGAAGFIASYIDYLRYRWSRYVVDFSQKDQISILSGIRDKIRWQKARAGNKFKLNVPIDKKLLLVLIIAGAAVWTFMARTGFGNFWSRGKGRAEGKATLIYRRALGILSKKGFKKPFHLTPLEFAERVRREGVDKYPTFSELTDKYLSLRFNGGGTDGDFDRLKGLLEGLKKDVE